MDAKSEHLVELLRRAQNQIATAPITIVGMQVTATSRPGGGNVTGLVVSAHAGPGSSGPVTGLVVTASSSQGDVIVAERKRLSAEIGEAIEDVEAGRPRKSALMRIAERLGGAALGIGAGVLKDQIEQAINGLPG